MAYLLRRPKLGRGSVRGILSFIGDGWEGYLHTGKKHDMVNGGYKKADYNQAQGPCFRWGCTADVPQGVKVFNKSAAIHKVSDKAKFRKLLADNGLAGPTFTNVHVWDAAQDDDTPVGKWVVRPRVHAQGKKIHLCTTWEQVYNAVKLYPGGYYIAQFFDKVKEYRVFVCQGCVVWVANKTPADASALAWNVAQGGTFDNVGWSSWNPDVVAAALKAMELSGLDYGGVDIMVDGEGKVCVLEINSAPSQTSPYRQECVAKAFKWMLGDIQSDVPGTIDLVKAWQAKRIENGKAVGEGAWRCFIHPGLWISKEFRNGEG